MSSAMKVLNEVKALGGLQGAPVVVHYGEDTGLVLVREGKAELVLHVMGTNQWSTPDDYPVMSISDGDALELFGDEHSWADVLPLVAERFLNLPTPDFRDIPEPPATPRVITYGDYVMQDEAFWVSLGGRFSLWVRYRGGRVDVDLYPQGDEADAEPLACIVWEGGDERNEIVTSNQKK